MMYLIGQLAVWLLLTAAFAAVAGWAYAARRAAPQELALRRERDKLLRDIARVGAGELGPDQAADERELESVRRLLEVRDGRIAELERTLEVARARADDAAGRIAELERAPPPAPGDDAEIARLREQLAQHERARAQEVEVDAHPVEPDRNSELQGWRLRYFEQRVRYLEGLAARAAPEPDEPAAAAPPLDEWRAREASARAAFLEQELRVALSARAAEVQEATPFAADAEVDMLMRWRLLYLERRMAHYQARAANLAAAQARSEAPASEDVQQPDGERWKWRTRYLESQLRAVESQAAPRLAAPAAAAVNEPKAEPPLIHAERPATLPAARDGAPDDFTLIEDVSVLQQTTLYSIGVFHFDQIAAWTPANVAWVDRYLRLRGRIDQEEWVEQARDLASDGVRAARRVREHADA